MKLLSHFANKQCLPIRTLTTATAIFFTFAVSSLAIADARGHLVIVGGGGTPEVILEKMLELAGGKVAKIIVLPHASSSEDRGSGSVEMFASVGAHNAQVLELDDLAAAAKAIEGADLIWFPGGSQRRLAEAIRTAKLVDAIRRRYADGAVIGGTSAGAAVMSELMIPGSPDEQRFVAGNTPISRGFGLAPALIVDQHFVRRNRMNRLLSAVIDHPERIGVGIDERTAIIVSGKRLTVHGQSSVVIIDARGVKANRAETGQLQTARKIRLDVLSQGDSFVFAATEAVSDDQADVDNKSPNTSEIPVGLSDFEFVDEQGNADKPIRVWLYRPKEFNAESPILFVMHGTLRNGETYREPWIPLADQYQCLVVVPEFSKTHYRSSRTYHFGNMQTKEGIAIESSKWTFSAIEHLFDDIRVRTGSSREKYSIFGHSAGSQFVHRMVLFKSDLRIEHAVTANSGSYTLPTFETDFPYGLKKSVVSDSQLRESFTVPLLVLLGEDDTDVNDKYLPRAPEAQAQGKHRLARGQHFFRVAQDSATRLKCGLNWQIKIVPNVGHDNKKMAPNAARAMFEMSRQNKR